MTIFRVEKMNLAVGGAIVERKGRKHKVPRYHRIGIVYEPADLLAFMNAVGQDEDRRQTFQDWLDITFEPGLKVDPCSLRYLTFAKSLSCVHCQITGEYLALEQNFATMQKQPKTFHFNLYARMPDGIEILMTKDHTHPRSLGGGDELENLQTMCMICNFSKQNQVEPPQILR